MMMRNSIKNLFDLKYIYIIVFITLAGWALFAYFTMTNLIASQEIYASIINLSGKQRMLSQKTTLIAKRYYETNDENLNKHLLELIQLMQNDHNYIIKNLNSNETKKIYFEEPINLNKEVTDFIKLLNSFHNNLDSKTLKNIEETSFNLLPQLNKAVYLFEQESKNKTQELLVRERFILFGTLFTLILEALLIVIPSIRRANTKEKQLNDLNKTLQKRVDETIEENRKKEKLLEHQFHISRMTEMMTNIAHQWRQPLSVISTMASGLKLEKELGVNNEKETIEKLDQITNSTHKLSSTIDSFINFLKQDNHTQRINISENIEKTLFILNSTLKDNDIKIEKNYFNKELILIGDSSKLSQILLSIITNSKDFLIYRNIENKTIKINTKTEDDIIIIDIEDNAGGIEDEAIDKIFDIYFTTKHKNQGTGLGLYIAYELVKKYFSGDIKATNSKNGAKFTILIPNKISL